MVEEKAEEKAEVLAVAQAEATEGEKVGSLEEATAAEKEEATAAEKEEAMVDSAEAKEVAKEVDLAEVTGADSAVGLVAEKEEDSEAVETEGEKVAVLAAVGLEEKVSNIARACLRMQK